MASAQSKKMLQWHPRAKLRPQIQKPPLRGFFVARPVRVFSRLEHSVRKEIKLPLIRAAIKIATTAIVQLIKHYFS